MELTKIANQASSEMLRASFIARCIFGDIDRCDRCFNGEENPNEEYNSEAVAFAASSALSRIVDAYQWYNGQILRLLVIHDRSAFEKIREGVTLTASDLRRIACGDDALPIAIERFRLRDRSVRQHLHKALDLWEEEEMSVMVDMRNCLVHHMAVDSQGEVSRGLAALSGGFGIRDIVRIEDDRIILTKDAPDVCTNIGLAQISIFDQMASRTFSLPTTPREEMTLRRATKG